MAKSQTTTGIAHTDDTTFRAWITELSGQLDAAGLGTAADTGQINLATATRPAVWIMGAAGERGIIIQGLHPGSP